MYLLDNPTKPVFQQILATTNGPEGILPIPGRKMLAVSSEVDDADAGVRSSVNLFRMSSTANGFPSIVSKDDENGAPIGWGALGALTEDAGKPGHLYAASDSAYATGRIYDVDVTTKPATITGVTTVTEGGAPATGLDIEGIATRQDGGFWLASEGTTGAKNTLVRTNAAGEVEDAAAVLGRPHRLVGTVVHGHHRGRELGYPTANLSPDALGLVPADGVYAGWLTRPALPDGAPDHRLPAAISIGTNPTFDDVHARQVEAYVLDRDDLDLYDERVCLDLVARVRPTERFDSVEELLVAMAGDVEACRRILTTTEETR